MILATLLRVIPTAGAADAAPRAGLWPCWQAHDDSNPQPVDTRPWRAFLQRHLRPGADGINRLTDGSVMPADRAALDADLQRSQFVPISIVSRAEQRTFWANLYNELTVEAIVQHYPVPGGTAVEHRPLEYDAADATAAMRRAGFLSGYMQAWRVAPGAPATSCRRRSWPGVARRSCRQALA